MALSYSLSPNANPPGNTTNETLFAFNQDYTRLTLFELGEMRTDLDETEIDQSIDQIITNSTSKKLLLFCSFTNKLINDKVLRSSKIVNWSFDERLGQINLTLTQKTNSETLFDVPVEFEFHFTDGMDPIVFEAKISTPKVNYEIPVKMKPKLILADPETVLLADIRVTEKR